MQTSLGGVKVLITTPIISPQIGGPATYVKGLLKKLPSSINTHIIAFSKKSNKPNQTSISTNGNTLVRQLKLLKEIVRHAKNTDLIYSLDPLVTGFSAWVASAVIGKPVIIRFVGDIAWESLRNNGKTTKDLETFYKHNPNPIRLDFMCQKLALTQSNHIIVPSHYLKKFLVTHYKVDPQKITIISNASEIDSTASVERKKNLLLTVARLVSHKHIDIIIKAVKIARIKNPWQLQIAGSGKEAKKLKQLVNKENATEWVKFLGRLDSSKLASKIKEATKLILLSEYEGQSHTLIEGLKTKTPIIASNIAPNKELLKDQATLVNFKNSHAVARAINEPTKVPEINPLDFSWHTHLNELLKVFSAQI